MPKHEAGHSGLFVVASVIFGLDVRTSKRSCLSLAMFLVISLVSYAGLFVGTIVHVRYMLGRATSFSGIAYFADDLISNLLAVHTMWLIIFKRAKLLELLHGSNQSWIRHLVLIILGAALVASNISYTIADMADGSVFENIIGFLFITLSFLRTFMLMIYSEAVSSLVQRCNVLLEAVTVQGAKTMTASNDKWKIRDSIRELNSLFAVPLSFCYVQILMGTIVNVSDLVVLYSLVSYLLDLVGLICFIITLYIVARQSSSLIYIFIEIERQVLERQEEELHQGVSCTIDPLGGFTFVQWLVLRFDETWDTLNVACFTHRQATFISYLSTCVTCVAVVLQFDFNVVGIINGLSQKYGIRV